MKRLYLLLMTLCALGPPVFAQVTGSITSSPGTACIKVDVGANTSTVGIQVTGTWSGTLQPEVAIQGQAAQNIQVVPSNSSTAQDTITADGIYVAKVAGANTFLLCGATVASGTAVVYLNSSVAVNGGTGFGGGGGSITAVNAGTGLNGGGSSGSVTLNLDAALPSDETATTQVLGDNTDSVATDAFVNGSIASIAPNPPYSGNQVIAGCGVEWLGLYNFTIGQCSYVIAGVQYSSLLTNITLAASDPTNDRIDVIGVDNTNSVFQIAGTPSATPLQPTVDPTSQLALTFVYVTAASSAANLTVVDIYHENAEWTTSKSGAPINLASTNNPYDGTVTIEATASTTGNYAQMTKPASGTVDLANYNALVFYLRSKATWGNNRSITVQWYSGATPKGAPLLIRPTGTFGFVSSQTASYQQISIPANIFGLNGIPVTSVRYTVSGTGGTIGWYLDDITLQGGQNGNPSGSFLTWRGTWATSVGYNVNDVVFYNGTSWICQVNNTASAPSLVNPNWSPTFNVGTNQQVLFNLAGVPSGSAGMLFDNATGNLTLTGTVTATSFITSGGGAFTLEGTEGTAPSGSVGLDILWADSTAHRWKMSNNNSAAFLIPGVSAAGTSAHCVQFAANGIDLADAGAACGSGSGTVTTTGSPASGNLTKFSGATSITNADLTGAVTTSGTVATTLATSYRTKNCVEVWGGSGAANAMASGDDAIVNIGCYNDDGATRTITAVKCRSDNAANTTTVNPTFGAAGTGTTILSGALTCGNSGAMSSSGTVSNAAWTTGTGVNPGMATVGNATSIVLLIEYTIP